MVRFDLKWCKNVEIETNTINQMIFIQESKAEKDFPTVLKSHLAVETEMKKLSQLKS